LPFCPFFASLAAMKRAVIGELMGVALCAVLLAGCVRVKAHQRGIHAKPAMQDQDEVEAKLDEHVKEYREGSVGGSGAGGGGCGCN
jgi:hypothetical protein